MQFYNRHLLLQISTLSTVLACCSSVFANDGIADDHHGDLHFQHPLVTESPSPDTKLRLDYSMANEPDEDGEAGAYRHSARLEAEYALVPSFSIEVNIPYTLLVPDEGKNTDHLDTAEIGFKYANFALSEYGMLLGGGIECGLPTGNDEKGIGSDHVLEVEPYLDFGYMLDELEVVGFISFGLPQNDAGDDEADLELGWNLSALYHVSHKVQALLELDGERIDGGEEDGTTIVNVTPGIKVEPFSNPKLQLGAGISLPLTDDKEFYARTIVSVFYHF